MTSHCQCEDLRLNVCKLNYGSLNGKYQRQNITTIEVDETVGSKKILSRVQLAPLSKNNTPILAVDHSFNQNNIDLTHDTHSPVPAPIKFYTKKPIPHVNEFRNITNLQECSTDTEDTEAACTPQCSKIKHKKNDFPSSTSPDDLNNILGPIYFDPTSQEWTIRDG